MKWVEFRERKDSFHCLTTLVAFDYLTQCGIQNLRANHSCMLIGCKLFYHLPAWMDVVSEIS